VLAPNGSSEAALVARDVWKQYVMGDVVVNALRGIDLELPQGQFAVLLGASGSGKTTLLNLAGGLDAPTQGSLAVCGHELSGMSDSELTEFRRCMVGFVFQMFNLVPTLTALENVRLVAQLVGDGAHAERVLVDVGLEDQLHYLPAQLSGGQQQRVAIARALVKRPKLLLADEPTGALDAETGRRVVSQLWETSREAGMTVMMVTHHAAFAAIGDTVVRLRSGEVVEATEHEAQHPSTVEF